MISHAWNVISLGSIVGSNDDKDKIRLVSNDVVHRSRTWSFLQPRWSSLSLSFVVPGSIRLPIIVTGHPSSRKPGSEKLARISKTRPIGDINTTIYLHAHAYYSQLVTSLPRMPLLLFQATASIIVLQSDPQPIMGSHLTQFFRGCVPRSNCTSNISRWCSCHEGTTTGPDQHLGSRLISVLSDLWWQINRY